MAMSYYQALEEAMDSSSDLCEWAEKAYRAAVRAKRQKPSSLLKPNLVRQKKRLLANWSE